MISTLLPFTALALLGSFEAPTQQASHTVVREGRLDSEDGTLTSGEYIDIHLFEVTEAGPVTVRLNGDFDGYLIVQPPDYAATKEGQLDNDDWNNDLTESRIEIPEAQVGTWKAVVTTASKGVGGNYSLSLKLPGQEQMVRKSTRTENGKLNIQDSQLGEGEYYDRYEISLVAGELLEVTMRSTAFDTYLLLATMGGDSLLQNDDFDDSIQVSHLEFTSEADETYLLIATSAPAEVTGPYTLTIEQTPPGATADIPGDKRRLTGSLISTDDTLDAGNYLNLIEQSGSPGEMLTVELNSTDFDTVLFIMGSDAELVEMNDDKPSGGTDSLVSFAVPADGMYTLAVSSIGIAEGDYELLISQAATGTAGAGTGPASSNSGANAEEFTGTLATDDESLDSGEFIDSIDLEVTAGEALNLFLQSSEFDAFLAVIPVEGDAIQVDNTDGSTDPRIIYTPTVSGTARVVVTSAQAKETGAYLLTVTRGAQASGDSSSGSDDSAPEPTLFEGTLEDDDLQLESGEFFDRHEVQLTAGHTYNCLMVSSEFNSYIGIRAPEDGVIVEDDDSGGDGDALLSYEAQETGTFTITATSSVPGELGSYTILVLEVDADPTTSPSSTQGEAAPPEGTLSLNSASTGTLAEGDETLNNGEFEDTWTFEAKAGETVFFELTSNDFDTYLLLVDSSEDVLQNDDLVEGVSAASGIEWTAPSDGRVAIVVTSYRRGETGNYTLTAKRGSGPAEVESITGRTFGVFVGISDYAGTDMDLPDCDQDAVRLKKALEDNAGMSANDAILLINRDASIAKVREAILHCAEQMQAGDTFVFFYSGHGTRVKRSQLVDRDPDGHDALDEALVLHDDLLLDDELNNLLNGFSSGTSLVILDACFSGGFSKDVISRPGRMGLFSSHEDVTSSTASKFKAGGFLAVFAAEAIGTSSNIADENKDGFLSAAELSQYIYEGYRNEVVREKSSDYLDVGDNLGYQQLIVDRGGVGVNTPLFQLTQDSNGGR